MAQSGYTPLLVYGSSTAAAEPIAANLTSSSNGAELALNYADGKLFYKNSGGNVRLLAVGYGSSTVTPTAGGVQYGTGSAVAFTAAGTAGYLLQSNGSSAPTWVAAPSTSPGGSTTQVQYNNAGAFAGSANFVWDNSNVRLGIGTASPNSILQVNKASANPTIIATRTTSSATTLGESLYLRLNDSFGTSFCRTEIGMGYGIPGTQTYTPAVIGYVQVSGTSNTNGDIYFATRSVTTDTAPTERMRIDSSGNVGIGTSSPGQKLDVHGTSGVALQVRAPTATNGPYLGLRVENALAKIYWTWDTIGAIPLSFEAGGNERMRIDSSGNLGLGVTPSAWKSDQKVIQLGISGSIDSNTSASNLLASSNAYFDSGGAWRYITTATATQYEQYLGAHKWYNAPSGTAGNTIGFTTAMALDTSNYLTLYKNSSNLARLYFNSSGTGLYYSDATGNLDFYTNSSSRLTIGYGGGVTASAGFTSSNITATSGIYCDNFGVYDQYQYMQFYRAYNNVVPVIRFYGGTGSALHYSTSGLSLFPSSDGGLTLGGSSNRWGQIYSTSGSINTSDEREKEQIALLDEAELRVANQLKTLIRKYKFKSAVKEKGGAARIHVGVIAQDVKAAFEAEGLDAHLYGVFCYDEKWVVYKEVNDLKTGSVHIETEVVDEGHEGAVLQTRYGVRYDELLAFIVAAL